MTDDSVSRYFEFYRVNLNGEKKSTEWFLGSNLQCCLHATVLRTVKYSAELNKYILFVRVCKKYRFRGQEKFASSQPVFFANNLKQINQYKENFFYFKHLIKLITCVLLLSQFDFFFKYAINILKLNLSSDFLYRH